MSESVSTAVGEMSDLVQEVNVPLCPFVGLECPTLYRTFTAGGGLEVRQCFDSGEYGRATASARANALCV